VTPFVIDPTPVTGHGSTCRDILHTVPTWFGIPEANEAYAAFADTHHTWVAYSDQGEPIGIVSGQQHFRESAEIEVLAVRAEWHRRGVGRALVDVFETYQREKGACMLEVKTLGPSHGDPGYALTRSFYTSIGFVPIEELWIWGPDNPALIMCKPIVPSPTRDSTR
jgi:GNAT superfamily N-acetyltransferase